MKFHAFSNVSQGFHGAPAQAAPAHGLVSHCYATAVHAHALAAGGVAGIGRIGGGFGGAIAHLFIWHLIWRAGIGVWRIPTVGPFVFILVIGAIVALLVLRKTRGPRWWNNHGGSTGHGTGRGPRDW